MTSQTPESSASVPAGPGGPLPFAVTGSGEFALKPDRTGTTTFTVTNLTGRPVRVRLQPKAEAPGSDSWYSLAGDPEVPMAVGATITVDVRAKVPADAAAGRQSMHLRAVDEADPELLTDGQAVAVVIPPAPVKPDRGPWLAIIIVALVLLLGGGVAIWWFLLRPTPAPPHPTASASTPGAPVLVAPPLITGMPNAAATLTANAGDWQGADSFTYQWVSCDAMANNCAPIASATTAAYVLSDGDVGRFVRVSVTANGPGGTSHADSANVGPIHVTQVKVPNVRTETWSQASGHLQALGLQIQATNPGGLTWCSTVVAQNPATDAVVDKGTVVQVTLQIEPFCTGPIRTFRPFPNITRFINPTGP